MTVILPLFVLLSGPETTVHEPSYTSVYRFERFRAGAVVFPQHIQELEEERRAFRAWVRLENMRKGLLQLLAYWPLALGLALGFLAPRLNTVLVRSHPLTVWAVFPFVLLANRPELHAAALSPIVMYLQFPIEGLIVQWATRRHVTVPAVAGRVFYLHYLCVLQLFMISGAAGRALMR